MMEISNKFLRSILDSVTEHIVVIDEYGDIQFVNRSWATFGDDNACSIDKNWSGINYLKECDKAAEMGDEFGVNAGSGIRNVINGKNDEFYFEYPCHSPDENRWFVMRVTPFELDTEQYFVVSHQNITERKLAEEKIKNLARIDGLTNIANRRTFDEFLNSEYRRCARLRKPLSLAIIDIDHFKLLNDTYGHQAGDEALKRVASVLEMFANRPGDLCSRYGGEEFAMVWSDTSLGQSCMFANKILEELDHLEIPNKNSPTSKNLTVSIGLSTIVPSQDDTEVIILKIADNLLYEAKERGRNRIVSK